METPQVRATLMEAKKESDRLHAWAAAAEMALLEAFAGFGWEPPARDFWVICERDEKPPEPVAPSAPETTQPELSAPVEPAEAEPAAPEPPKQTPPLPRQNHPNRGAK